MKLEIEPGRKAWLTADLHYGHANILSYCRRPQLTPAQVAFLDGGERRVTLAPEQLWAHDNMLVENIVAAVGPDDILIINGDLAWRGRLTELADRLSHIDVWATVGNHDVTRELQRAFGDSRVRSSITLTVRGKPKALVHHYPVGLWGHIDEEGRQLDAPLLIHGHQHRRPADVWSRTPAGLRLDCGVDGNNFRPWAWDDIIKQSASHAE